MQTSLPGVYAAGDIVRGASLVVWAIRDGREAAEAMLDYICADRRGGGGVGQYGRLETYDYAYDNRMQDNETSVLAAGSVG